MTSVDLEVEPNVHMAFLLNGGESVEGVLVQELESHASFVEHHGDGVFAVCLC